MNKIKIVIPVKIFKGELNPFDQTSLETALTVENADITVISMLPESNIPALNELTRYGVKTLAVTDNIFKGADTVATSFVLSEVIKKIGFDCIFCGKKSVDGDTAQVPLMLAERLKLPVFQGATSFENGYFSDRNGNTRQIENGVIYTFEKFKPLRFPSIFSRAKETEILTNADLNLSENLCGSKGSPTRVISSYESTVGRRFCKFVNFEDIDGIINNSLKKEERKSAVFDKITDEIYYKGDIDELVTSLADRVCKITSSDVDEVEKILKEKNAKTFFLADDPENKELASRLAVRLNAGLLADCIGFSKKDGKIILTRPSFGGDITADIVCDSPLTIATVRTAQKNCKDVMFCVGTGVMDKVDEIKTLAKKYDAEVCATRPVVDKGVLPYASQVGLTGRSVSPKVYVAFGVSGAVQHVSAIERSGTVIAVNSDKNAKIFDYADYGVIKEI